MLHSLCTADERYSPADGVAQWRDLRFSLWAAKKLP
jgi:hypothetical protein